MCWSGWSWNLSTCVTALSGIGIRWLLPCLWVLSLPPPVFMMALGESCLIFFFLLSFFVGVSSLIKQAHFCIQYFFSCILGQLLPAWVGILVQLHTCQGWRSCSACHRGLSSPNACCGCWSVCHFLIRSRDIPFPLKGVEQDWIFMGEAPACGSDLFLSGIVRVTAYFLQIFYQFFWILHFFRGEVPKHWRCLLS